MRSVFKASPLGVSAAVEECPTPLPQPMASTTTVVRANLEEGVERLADTATEKVQRPLLCFVLVTLSLVVVVAGGGPMPSWAAIRQGSDERLQTSSPRLGQLRTDPVHRSTKS